MDAKLTIPTLDILIFVYDLLLLDLYQTLLLPTGVIFVEQSNVAMEADV
jgi:hypothetical protein